MVIPSRAQTDIRFPESDPEEEFIFYFRQHWIRLLWPFIRCIFLSAFIIGTGVLLFGFIGIDDPSLRRALLMALCIFFAGAHFEFLARLYCYFLYVIIVTDRKIHRMKKTLITFDDHESIDLPALQDIRKSQHGIVQNMLGFGSIVLDAHNTIMRLKQKSSRAWAENRGQNGDV